MSAELIAEFKSKLDEQSKSIDGKLESIAKLSEEKQKEEIAKLEGKMAEYVQTAEEVKSLKDALVKLEQKGVKLQEPEKDASIGEAMVKSEQFKNWMDGRQQKARTEVKNTIVNAGNNTSRHDQLPGVVPGAFRALTVMSTLQMGTTTSNIVYYSKETAWTNNADGTAESAQKPESALTFIEVETAVRTIAHIIKVSKQALADSTFLSSYIDARMSHGVNNKIEMQVIQGDGTGQNLSGWLATGNSTAIPVGGNVNFYDYANSLKYAIIAADYMPDVYYANPADWAAAEKEKDGEGRYLAESGAVTYVNNGVQPMLWGLPVVLSNNVPVNTLICKARDADMLVDRETTVVEMFEQDGDNVQTNLVTVRAEARVAELVMVPAAIATGDLSTLPA